jgi:hypothetical protein
MPQGAAAGANALVRAVSADANDLAEGGYRFAVFVKADDRPIDVTAPAVTWYSQLARSDPGQYSGPAVFLPVGRTESVTVRGLLSQALLDTIGEAGSSWEHALPKARDRLMRAQASLHEQDESAAAADLETLWRFGFVSPSA